MDRTLVQSHTGSFGHIMQTFALSLLVSFIGTLAGAMFIPPSLVGLFIVVEVVMLVSVFIIRFRGKTIGYPFLYIFTAVTGVTLYPVIANYGGLLGANLVSVAFLATAGIFGGLSFYAYRSQRDFSFLGGFLFAATIGLIVVSLASLFIPMGSVTNLVISVLGIVVFSGWVLYDVSQYKDGVGSEQVPMAALNIYLNFINLFIYILRFLASIVGFSRN
ncbi:Bax inhibitor-1/YccA family protein [Paenibacillus agricola]|uniref:Bax inhibitor-1/YccA family protein n=1 Tax=Paenibacillus agricola TaxID=2716264 RepID=A0ABX0J335_9BACL|nr:Bax inhibitor-1/YccA family protein [Paenibacillus agricola]NHN30557.1 Bax inhibitor-1/YccA family protein [Paenibacillus agricola]